MIRSQARTKSTAIEKKTMSAAMARTSGMHHVIRLRAALIHGQYGAFAQNGGILTPS